MNFEGDKALGQDNAERLWTFSGDIQNQHSTYSCEPALAGVWTKYSSEPSSPYASATPWSHK